MAGRRILVRGIPYQIEQQIGHGLHSLVYGGSDLRTGQSVAIKITNFAHGSVGSKADTESRQQSFFKEIRMLLYLQRLNPYIIRVFAHDYNNAQGIIVMERGETLRDTLVEYMLNGMPLPPFLVHRFWSQMVESIFYMHRIGIVHGDVKPENFIQVGSDRTTLRLIDMGISFQLPPNVTSRLKTAAGTPDYVSPEMVSSRVGSSSRSKCGYKADIWALGVILFEMAFGYRPLQGLSSNSEKLRFLGYLHRDIKIPKHPNKNLRKVLQGCLRANPRRRFTIEEVFDHSYVMEG
ncbi:unnamed protein product [Rotaria magnacalcarata]|uniref:Protein kinase domain-containing protein n=4 Tax=Rotaria magnacalcarata TaxID=392030 RepID=A0A816Y4I0_9BILA|nr:unnamed protein product [Rotaria magnacalcarata]CAF1575434.1 unnamed protein product [Rotaria magnacalcarata]CAF2057765.1 unnamed protein product [Rotaria magnacalcarata]CAF2136649.1 unnamed protein product [Rotaria magnacalcarata]CAF2154654.1 unnamed protein product [Rotaria magnacalcarata]